MPSSVIRFFRHLPEEQALEILFNSGKRYRYLEVPEALYLQMRAAFSKGEFFNAHIRDHYKFIRVEEPAPGEERKPAWAVGVGEGRKIQEDDTMTNDQNRDQNNQANQNDQKNGQQDQPQQGQQSGQQQRQQGQQGQQGNQSDKTEKNEQNKTSLSNNNMSGQNKQA